LTTLGNDCDKLPPGDGMTGTGSPADAPPTDDTSRPRVKRRFMTDLRDATNGVAGIIGIASGAIRGFGESGGMPATAAEQIIDTNPAECRD